MRRWLFNLLAMLSLLLFAAVVVLWVRSYRDGWRGEGWAFECGGRRWELRSQAGGVRLCELDRWFFSGPSTGGTLVERFNARDVVGIPHWLALAAATPLPVAWLTTRRRLRRRLATGRCPACGYDLRATPDRCPECGKVARVTA